MAAATPADEQHLVDAVARKPSIMDSVYPYIITDHWLQHGPGVATVPVVSAADRAPPALDDILVDTARLGRGTLAWLLPALLAGCVGLVRLAWPGLTAEELTARDFASIGWGQVFDRVPELPPGTVLFHLLIRCWASVFGVSDFALRTPSVLAVAATTALTAMVATRLATPRIGLLAGLLIAVAPAASLTAQHAAAPAMTMFAAAVATFALVRAAMRPGPLRIAAYGWSVALLALGQPVGLALLAGHLVALALFRRTSPTLRNDLLNWAAAVLFAAVPGLLLLIVETSPAWGRSPVVPVASLPWAGQLGEAAIAGILLILGLLAIGGGAARWLTALAVVPILVQVPVLGIGSLSLPGTAAYLLPAWACLGAMVLGRSTLARGAFVVVAAAVLTVPAHLAIRAPDGHGLASARLAAELRSQELRGDAIIYGPADGDGRAARELVTRYLPGDAAPVDVLAVKGNAADGITECVDVDQCLGHTSRIWVIRFGPAGDPLDGMEAAKDRALRLRYTAQQTWEFTGLTLTVFQRGDAT